MKNRKDKILAKYEEYKVKFEGKSDEEIQKSISNLDEAIQEKTLEMKKTVNTEEKDKLESIISKMKQERDNIAGYNKNKSQIEKIRSYRNKLNEKIKPLEVEKQKAKIELQNNKNATEETLQRINKILQNPKETEKLDQNQYNNLLILKEEHEKKRAEIQNRINEIEGKIDTLKSSVSKCDLAWRSLFNDKSWDEIQVRALNNKKFVNKEKNKETNKEINTDAKEQESKTKQETSLTKQDDFAKRHPILAKIRNLLKKIVSRKNNRVSDKELDEVAYYTDKTDTSLIKQESFAEKHPILNKIRDLASNVKTFVTSKFNKTETSKNIDETTEKSNERDAFIEELRRHVNNDKSDKEKAYIEKHKAKNKEENKQEIER